MYHHFASKQALVIAYLEDQKHGWKAGADAADNPGSSAGERIGYLFTVLADAVDSGTFHGCPFTNAAIERPDDSQIWAVIIDYRRVVAAHFGGLLGAGASPQLVALLMVLYDGATTGAKLSHSSHEVRIASELAQQLVQRTEAG